MNWLLIVIPRPPRSSFDKPAIWFPFPQINLLPPFPPLPLNCHYFAIFHKSFNLFSRHQYHHQVVRWSSMRWWLAVIAWLALSSCSIPVLSSGTLPISCVLHFLCASTRPLASIICTPRPSWPGLPLKSLSCPALLLWPILFGKHCPAVNAVHQQQQQQRNRTRSIVWHHHRGSDFLPPWSPPSSDMASETEIYYKKEEPPTTQCISGPRNLQWRFRLFMILFAPPNTTTHHHSSLLLDMNPAFRPFQQSVVGRTTTFSSAAIHHRLHSHFYQKEGKRLFDRFTPQI